ncbi:Similar to Protein D1; acc. no. P54186 [Pyronema omphalodes CBS 100304]|uniref:Similar to Protein D1 acc. no. P54186 n=1 Tax=Pyronema omphalodes (strain CBS 100304) TaxID=1076935 RepID=U4KV53_PYROM|nr:Similar to Protein D1; acc. no. P54186 [Pyronema omphalodes CBS 100304]
MLKHLLSLLLVVPAVLGHSSHGRTDLTSVKEAFKADEIVPQIIPRFEPIAQATLTFNYANGSSVVISGPGTRIQRNDAQIAPAITIGYGRHPPKYYVGVIVDPDAPSRQNPIRRSIRHYLARDLTIDRKTGFLKNFTAVANEYRGPNPPAGSGGHRYIFFLYKQPKNLDISFLDLNNRTNFNLAEFVEKTGLGDPIAGNYFVSEYQAPA